MIKNLTEKQISKFQEYIEEWTRIGLCTDPAHRKMAEAGLRESYKSANLEPPSKIVWCGSPLGNALTRAIVLNLPKNMRASVGESVGESVWASVWESVWESVGESVRASVGASVGDSVRESVRASVWASVWASGYGQHDANWIGFYHFFRMECGLISQTEKIQGLETVCRSAGWFIPHQKICWISERHDAVRKDQRGRIHSESSPAIHYPDGWSIYAWHGVRVPEQVILCPNKMTPKSIMAEENAQVRMIMIERYGFDRFMLDAGATTLDTVGEYRLVSVPDPQWGHIKALKMVCPSTSAVFVIPVDPKHEKVTAALDQIKGIDNYLERIKLQT